MDCQKTLWAWGDDHEVIDRLRASRRTIGSFPDISYIEIQRYEDILGINFVQKGTNWPDKESFCKPMLMATVSDFLIRHEINLGEDISLFKAVNIANPKVAGCKCYVGLFSALGYTEINGRSIRFKTEIDEFCTDEGAVLILAERGEDEEDEEIVLPSLSMTQTKHMSLANIFDE